MTPGGSLGLRDRRRRQKALRGLKAAATQQPEGRAGLFIDAWRRPTKGAAPRARARNTRGQGVRVGLAATGQLGYDPRLALSYMVRNALQLRSLAPVTVYDAAGVAIATINPLTRERTPLVAPGSPT